MSKHRRGPSAAPSPPPRPARELLIWSTFGCALVPVALVWSGTGWAVALGVAGLLVLLVLGCTLALRFSGMSLLAIERDPPAEHREDERPAEE